MCFRCCWRGGGKEGENEMRAREQICRRNIPGRGGHPEASQGGIPEGALECKHQNAQPNLSSYCVPHDAPWVGLKRAPAVCGYIQTRQGLKADEEAFLSLSLSLSPSLSLSFLSLFFKN